jgi:vacuolar-type H+-ATPase subunit H
MSAAASPDVLTLLDQLEELIASATSLPVGGRVMLPRDQALDFIDAIRGELPETVIEADRVSREKSRIIAGARAEAEQLIERAREQAAYLVQEHVVLKSAELEAERVLNRAREESADITASAERYAHDLFTRLEEEALRLAADVRKAAGLTL